MSTDKEKIIKLIEELPDLSYDELVHQLISYRLTNSNINKLTPEIFNQWIEISKLALEEKKLNTELQIKKQEIEAKTEENKGLSAGYTAIIAAILGFLTSSIVALIQGQSNLQLESSKFDANQKLEQLKFETGLIAKGIEPQKEQDRIDLLNFYINAGLISNPDIVTKLGKIITDKKVPQATLNVTSQYEGRKDLGNVQVGDGARFTSRGYVKITGRSNYEYWKKVIGVDLVNNPEMAANPEIAAKVLVQFMNSRNIKQYLDKGNFKTARLILYGGLNGLEEVNARTDVYLNALEKAPKNSDTLQISGINNPEWIRLHVPVILKEMRNAKITSPKYQAYTLATAELESKEGTEMVER